MTGYIYCHTSPSGKKYIGQTTTSLKHRFNNGKNYYSSPVFWKAIQKYGWDNFEHKILDEVQENDKIKLIEKLNTLEEKRITEFNSIVPNGYNIDLGGGQHKITEEKARQISSTMLKDRTPTKEQLLELYVIQNKTMKEVGEILGVDRNIISKWLKWYNIPINYKHRNTKQISMEEFKKYYIEENHTQKECAEYFDISLTYIPKLIKRFNLYKRRAK